MKSCILFKARNNGNNYLTKELPAQRTKRWRGLARIYIFYKSLKSRILQKNCLLSWQIFIMFLNVECQNVLDKHRIFPVCYSIKHFVNSRALKTKILFENRKKKSVGNFRTFTIHEIDEK